MTIEEIRRHRNAQPFAPFEIQLRDGRELPVERRERVAIAPWGKIHVWVENTPNLFDLAQVAAIRTLTAGAA